MCVCVSYLAPSADEDVVRLHVPVDDAVGVKVMQSEDELPRDGLHDRLWESLIILQHTEQLALGEFHHDAEVPRCFKRVQHEDDVLVPQGAQDLAGRHAEHT